MIIVICLSFRKITLFIRPSQVTLLLKMADHTKRAKSNLFTRFQLNCHTISLHKMNTQLLHVILTSAINRETYVFTSVKNVIFTSDWKLGQCSWILRSHQNFTRLSNTTCSKIHLEKMYFEINIVLHRSSQVFTRVCISYSIDLFQQKNTLRCNWHNSV